MSRDQRVYVEQRLAEINTEANAPPPPMAYWTRLRHASSAARRLLEAANRKESNQSD